MLSTRGSSRPIDGTQVSYVFYIGRWVLYHWATWEAPIYKYQEFAFLMNHQVMSCYWSRVHSLKTNSLSIVYLILELYIIILKNQICAEKHILFHQKCRLLLSTWHTLSLVSWIFHQGVKIVPISGLWNWVSKKK